MSSWLDEMPPVPLERGVPVTIPEGGFRGVVVLEDGWGLGERDEGRGYPLVRL